MMPTSCWRRSEVRGRRSWIVLHWSSTMESNLRRLRLSARRRALPLASTLWSRSDTVALMGSLFILCGLFGVVAIVAGQKYLTTQETSLELAREIAHAKE